jgi:tetratricopeptide (TPR) repeat protein
VNRAAEQRVRKALGLYGTGKPDDALRMLDDVIQAEDDPSIKFGLLYYQMSWLLDMSAVSQAREKFNEMQEQTSYIDGFAKPKDSRDAAASFPQDTKQNDLAAYLAVMARFAESKLLIKEGNESSALSVLEDLMSRYPRQLSSPHFRELRGEADMKRGMLLANADRWLEAGVFLEKATSPKNLKPILCYYLGQYYFTVRKYQLAAKTLRKSITADTPPKWRGRGHYMLALAEYHLSHVKEAKEHFELSVRIADTEYIRKNNIWGWLEKTAHALGNGTEAEQYKEMREQAENPGPN